MAGHAYEHKLLILRYVCNDPLLAVALFPSAGPWPDRLFPKRRHPENPDIEIGPPDGLAGDEAPMFALS
jgi:hypothetical protein